MLSLCLKERTKAPSIRAWPILALFVGFASPLFAQEMSGPSYAELAKESAFLKVVVGDLQRNLGTRSNHPALDNLRRAADVIPKEKNAYLAATDMNSALLDAEKDCVGPQWENLGNDPEFYGAIEQVLDQKKFAGTPYYRDLLKATFSPSYGEVKTKAGTIGVYAAFVPEPGTYAFSQFSAWNPLIGANVLRSLAVHPDPMARALLVQYLRSVQVLEDRRGPNLSGFVFDDYAEKVGLAAALFVRRAIQYAGSEEGEATLRDLSSLATWVGSRAFETDGHLFNTLRTIVRQKPLSFGIGRTIAGLSAHVAETSTPSDLTPEGVNAFRSFQDKMEQISQSLDHQLVDAFVESVSAEVQQLYVESLANTALFFSAFVELKIPFRTKLPRVREIDIVAERIGTKGDLTGANPSKKLVLDAIGGPEMPKETILRRFRIDPSKSSKLIKSLAQRQATDPESAPISNISGEEELLSGGAAPTTKAPPKRPVSGGPGGGSGGNPIVSTIRVPKSNTQVHTPSVTSPSPKPEIIRPAAPKTTAPVPKANPSIWPATIVAIESSPSSLPTPPGMNPDHVEITTEDGTRFVSEDQGATFRRVDGKGGVYQRTGNSMVEIPTWAATGGSGSRADFKATRSDSDPAAGQEKKPSYAQKAGVRYVTYDGELYHQTDGAGPTYRREGNSLIPIPGTEPPKTKTAPATRPQTAPTNGFAAAFAAAMEKALTALVSEEDVAAVALGSIMDRAFELKTAKALETYGFSEARWAAEQLQAGRIQLRNARFTQKASATTRTLGVYVPGTYSLWGIGIIGVDFNAMKDNPSKILQTILHEIVHYHDEVAAVWGIANYTQIETEYHAHIAHNKLARASEMRRAGDLSFNQPTWETLFERDFGAGIRANVLSVYAPQLGASTETPVQTTAEQNSRALQVDPLWILTRNSNAQPWQRPQPNHFISYVTPRK